MTKDQKFSMFLGFCALLLMLITIAIALSVQITQLQQRVDEIDRDLCAWVFFEDGSAAPQTNDWMRWECRSDG